MMKEDWMFHLSRQIMFIAPTAIMESEMEMRKVLTAEETADSVKLMD